MHVHGRLHSDDHSDSTFFTALLLVDSARVQQAQHNTLVLWTEALDRWPVSKPVLALPRC